MALAIRSTIRSTDGEVYALALALGGILGGESSYEVDGEPSMVGLRGR
jgi:hypothetical protein